MTIQRMSPDKSHLLAYLKHTPEFETKVWDMLELTVEQTLERLAQEAPSIRDECVDRLNLHRYQTIPA